MTITISFWGIYWVVTAIIGLYGIICLSNSSAGLGALFGALPLMASILMSVIGGLAMVFG